MADFSADPSLQAAVPQAPNVLGMANQAAALNQHMVQTTGMNLDQHFKRMGALANGLSAMINPQTGTADPKAVKNGIIDAFRGGLINAQEAASQMTAVPPDPSQAGDWVRSHIAAVGAGMSAIAPMINYQSTGSGSTPTQGNFAAKGGLVAPTITNGTSADTNTAMETWYNPQTGKMEQGTHAQHVAALGGSTAPVVGGNALGGGVAGPSTAPAIASPSGNALSGYGNNISGNKLAPSAPQIGQQAVAALGSPPAQTPAQPASIGTPMSVDPQVGVYQGANAKSFQSDVEAGTGPDMQTRIDNLREINTVAGSATTGAYADQRTFIGKLAELAGGPTQGATDADILHKLTSQAASYLPGSGTSDAARNQAIGMTPNGSMTKDALKTTSALILGKALYDQQYAKDAQAWKDSGGDVTNDYTKFKAAYAETHPGPMLYGMMAMRENGDVQGFNNMVKYIKGLPTNERSKISAQIGTLKSQMGN